MSSIQPLGHRILVTPDAQPEATDSGLVLPQDHDHIPMSGTVVALGPGGAQVRFRARQRAIRDCLEIVDSMMTQCPGLSALARVRDEIAGMLGSSDPEREIRIGDRVAYSADVGLLLTQDDEPFIVLNEDDVAVLVTEEEEVAA